ncbi:unnamed protein product [Gemmataceae bacterium]|nr:unnamed protein product [Gemmataceae bacterium]VTT99571.1 unnamed protein product [Gemmataceae bacterium]
MTGARLPEPSAGAYVGPAGAYVGPGAGGA